MNPIWLVKALTYLGLTEIKGSQNAPEIVQFWKDIKLGGIKDDETSWCAAFVGAMLEDVGIQSTRSASARSYDTLDWGIKQAAPAVGSIVIFWRDDINGIYGHVGFVAGRDQSNNLMVVGGNQGDMVCVKPFSTGRVLSYRWPLDVDLPTVTGLINLPLINSDGVVSTNEA